MEVEKKRKAPFVFFSTSICSRFKKIPRRDFFEQKILSLNASFLPSEHWKHTFFVHILAKLYSRLFRRKIPLQISNSGVLFCDKMQTIGMKMFKLLEPCLQGTEAPKAKCQVCRAKVVWQSCAKDHLLLTPMATNPASLKIKLGSPVWKFSKTHKCLGAAAGRKFQNPPMDVRGRVEKAPSARKNTDLDEFFYE